MEKILKFLIKKLKGINYVFIGSISLRLQGMNAEVKDIDILTTKRGTFQIARRLKKYQTRSIYFDKSQGRNSYRAFFKIYGKEVEVLGNVNNKYRPKNSLKKKIFVNFKNLKIPCLPLKEEAKVYAKMGRKDKVAIINKLLSQLD